jgi:hypothetical protein
MVVMVEYIGGKQARRKKKVVRYLSTELRFITT